MAHAKKILLSAFDIGGGNAVFPVAEKILKDKKSPILLMIGGPSKEIFKKKRIKFIDVDSLQFGDLKKLVIDFQPDFLISGTSAGLTFDKKILDDLKKIGTKSIYILDYWANYWQRFSSEKKDFRYLPDMICVMDEKAKTEMLEEGFDSRTIFVTGNPYFDYFQKNITKRSEIKSQILFLSQPISEKEGVSYDEFTAIEGVLKVLRAGDFPHDFSVIIRPHPRENSEKFGRYIDSKIKIDDKTSVEKLLSKSGLVIGMTSMVLFQAAIAGKRVISYQPNLKTKDFSMKGEFGIGHLATSEKDLKDFITRHFNGTFPDSGKISDIIVPHATENIIKIIK